MFAPEAIDHPAGTVKVAPPGVTLGVSADTCCGAAEALDCDIASGAKAANARKAKAKALRTVRYLDMQVTPCLGKYCIEMRSCETSDTSNNDTCKTIHAA
jgi:hypothetical protein